MNSIRKLIVGKIIFHGKESHQRWLDINVHKIRLPESYRKMHVQSEGNSGEKKLKNIHDLQKKYWIKIFDSHFLKDE